MATRRWCATRPPHKHTRCVPLTAACALLTLDNCAQMLAGKNNAQKKEDTIALLESYAKK